ncbi:MAG TPA: hypothetical protein VGD64_10865 [Acidisarcina sp.]
MEVTPNCKLMAVLALSALITAPAARAQQQNANPPTKVILKQIWIEPHNPPPTAAQKAVLVGQASSGQTIPLWNYTTVAQDGNTYSGSMVGRSPFAHGHRTTTLPTYLVPVIFTFQDSGDVFDPTVADGCGPANESVMTLIQNSPLFNTTNFTMNGVSIGAAQYLDAFQRASFWSKIGGTPYHSSFSSTPPVVTALKITVPSSHGVTIRKSQFGGCRDLGELDLNWFDAQIQSTLIPQLASQGVGPANFPQFIFNSVAQYIGFQGNCCALGYHSAYTNSGGIFQTYSVNEYDTSGGFGGDTSVMSHEIAEWMDDPDTSNPTPAWGAEGQVTSGNCQNNLEVGDPLSPGYPTPTNPFHVINNTTGVTYTLQELAFYSWFLGSSPSLGAGGKYSDNGTFKGFSKPCPPGGSF